MKAYYLAERQRTEMIMHYERSQTQRSLSLKQEQEWRTGRREAVERLTD